LTKINLNIPIETKRNSRVEEILRSSTFMRVSSSERALSTPTGNCGKTQSKRNSLTSN
jgi:hypothetical protein